MSLDSLSAQQLSGVKKQLDEEVEHLTTSFAQLQAAQIKFKDCLRCVKAQGATPGEQSCYVAQVLGAKKAWGGEGRTISMGDSSRDHRGSSRQADTSD